MSDGASGAASAAIEGAAGDGGNGGAGGAGGAGGDGGNGGGGAERWQDKWLPDDIRGDETLARYKDIPSLAKGLIETQQWARGRIAVPGADATDEQWTEFVGKVRPEKAEDYDIPLPDGQKSDLADAMRPVFHELGLHPRQARALSEKWNQIQADTVSRMAQANRDEIKAIELDMGEAAYNQRITAVANMMQALGHEDFSVIDTLESALSKDGAPGAGKAMQLLFTLAERTGELAKVDGATVAMRTGKLTPEQASARLDEMQANPEMRKKYSTPGTPENRLYNDLIKLSAQAR